MKTNFTLKTSHYELQPDQGKRNTGSNSHVSRNGNFLLYEGDLYDADLVLSWILDEETLEIPGVIEEVGVRMLNRCTPAPAPASSSTSCSCLLTYLFVQLSFPSLSCCSAASILSSQYLSVNRSLSLGCTYLSHSPSTSP